GPSLRLVLCRAEPTTDTAPRMQGQPEERIRSAVLRRTCEPPRQARPRGARAYERADHPMRPPLLCACRRERGEPRAERRVEAAERFEPEDADAVQPVLAKTVGERAWRDLRMAREHIEIDADALRVAQPIFHVVRERERRGVR